MAATSNKKRKKSKGPALSSLGARVAFGAAACVVIAWGIHYEMRRTASVAWRAAGKMVPADCTARDYEPAVRGCSPTTCGRLVVDNFTTPDEIASLRALAERGMALGGGAGGPTILDLQSGALSLGDKFVDVWTRFDAAGAKPFTRSDVAVYAGVTERIRRHAEIIFGSSGLKLTAPTFFSRISGDKPPTTEHDEYWHAHVDARQYGSFVYTALLYLEDADNFEGGLFQFLPPAPHGSERLDGAEAVAEVRPKKGRLVLFTSGHEHPHRVTQVTGGTRYALTIAFTCDADAAVQDFLGRALPDEEA